MKKILSVILSILFICPQALASNMYLLKNTNASVVAPYIEDGISKKNYYIDNTNPYHAYNITNHKEQVTIILQPAGNDLYYFYKSTNDKNDVDKAIQKNFRRADIVYEQANNTSYIQTFENQAAQVKPSSTGIFHKQQKPAETTVSYGTAYTQTQAQPQKTQSQTVYTFDDETYNKQVQQTPVTYNSNILKGYVGEVATGTTFGVYLQTPINTATAQQGDQITAVLTEDWVYKNNVIAPQGSIVSGYLSKARAAAYGSRNGRVVIDFNQITTPEGKTYNISAEAIDFTVTNDGKWSKVAGNVVGMTIAGALVGLLFAAIGGNNIGAGAAIGAGSGAAMGAIATGAERGVDAEIPIYTELEITLNKPLNVVLNY